MLFSSPAFFVFFAAYVLAHRMVPARFRLSLVILGSALFYSYWNPWYGWLPFALAGLAYGAGLWVAHDGPGRGMRLGVSLAAIFAPLLVFKYTNFIATNLAGHEVKLIEVGLPLGISFVTFSMTAYVVDIHRRRFGALHRPGPLVAYTLFFPHLIAGPILRPADLVPQLERLQQIDFRHIRAGLAVFTLGLLKKLLIADPVGGAVDALYAQAAGAGGLSALEGLLAIAGFTVQIYCDFSGYTDMAIGSALVLGVRLPTNFARPYSATSFIEFWKRWHITLSQWLRDYLYIPLGGNRGGMARQSANLLITMALGGLWHGANWTFVVWGVLHGLFIVLNHWARQFLPGLGALPAGLRRLVVLVAVMGLWVFFRSPDLAVASAIFGALGNGLGQMAAFGEAHAYVLAAIAVFAATHAWDDHRRIIALSRKTPAAIGLAVMAVLWIIAISASTGNSGKFVYFDF